MDQSQKTRRNDYAKSLKLSNDQRQGSRKGFIPSPVSLPKLALIASFTLMYHTLHMSKNNMFLSIPFKSQNLHSHLYFQLYQHLISMKSDNDFHLFNSSQCMRILVFWITTANISTITEKRIWILKWTLAEVTGCNLEQISTLKKHFIFNHFKSLSESLSFIFHWISIWTVRTLYSVYFLLKIDNSEKRWNENLDSIPVPRPAYYYRGT